MTFLGSMHRKALKEAEEDASLRISELDRSGFALQFEEWIEPPMRALGVNETKLLRLQALSSVGTYASLEREVSAFQNHIRDEVSCEFFYHYPPQRACLLMGIDKDWVARLANFPSAKEDIHAAVDCYALQQNTASVFHSMRIAELGLRAFAWSQGIKGIGKKTKPKPIEWANWLDIIKELEAIQLKLRNMPAGPKKDTETAFFSGALADMNAFKDEFRNMGNMVMHVRVSYDEFQSARALNRVREFMNRLSDRMDENGKKVKNAARAPKPEEVKDEPEPRNDSCAASSALSKRLQSRMRN